MTIDDEPALLKAVIENPDDDAPRLAYADWCDRRGDPRGRFIRVQLELAKIMGQVENPNWDSLTSESLDLQAKYERDWVPKHHAYILRSTFHRGFIASIEITADAFLDHAQDIYTQFPIQLIRFNGLSGRQVDVLTSPLLGQLSSISLSRSHLTDEDILIFARSPFTKNIWWLDLSFNNIGLAGVEALILSGFLRNLGFVSLEGNPCNPIETAGFDQGILTDLQMPKDGQLLEEKFGHIKWLHYRQSRPLLPVDQR